MYEFVQRFPGKRIVVVGDVMLDRYLVGNASRVCSEAPVPVVRKTGEERYAGGAGNTAVNVRALGAEVELVSVTGRDEAGGILRETLEQRGVSDDALIEDARSDTHQKLRIVAGAQYVVRFDEGKTRTPDETLTDRLCDALERALPRADAIVISDYNYGATNTRLLELIRAYRTTRPIPLIIDSKNLRRFRNISATLVTPNLLEAQLLTGTDISPQPVNEPAGIEFIAHQLLSMIDTDATALTLGEDGVLLLDRQHEPEHVPARFGLVRTDIGAGDAFAAATALSLSSEASLREAVVIGVEAAGIAVSNRRTAITRYQDILQRLSVYSDRDPRADGPDMSARSLAAQLDGHRRRGETVVFANGVFDLLHAGHVQFLQRARSLGDVLVVGVNSDRSLRRVRAESSPATQERHRLALASSLATVDYAVLFDEETPADLIRVLRPDIHVKGGDYADQPLPEREAVDDVGGRIVILPLMTTDHQSSPYILRSFDLPVETSPVETSMEDGGG